MLLNVSHLENQNMLDNTYIIFTSDHGLAVGQHGLIGKQSLYDHSIRVPMIISGPKIKKGLRFQEDIYLQDIVPTTLDLAKITVPKGVDFKSFYKLIVNRENKKDAYGAFMSSSDKLDNGFNVCIFPEGGVPPPQTILRRFKNGPFKLAIEKNIKIVPVSMPNNKQCFPWSYLKGRPRTLNIKVHAPIDCSKKENKDIKNLNNNVYNTIFEELSNYES